MFWLPVGAYLLGSIPFAYLVVQQVGGVDLRTAGSGNVGATNVLRTSGVAPAVVVALLDVAKGSAAVWLAGELGAAGPARAAAAIAVVLGHVYPVWLRFHGGKGVATGAGAFLVLAPLPTAIAAIVFATAVFLTRYVSVGSLLAAASLPLLVLAWQYDAPVTYASAIVGATIVACHRDNLRRLAAGIERRLGERA